MRNQFLTCVRRGIKQTIVGVALATTILTGCQEMDKIVPPVEPPVSNTKTIAMVSVQPSEIPTPQPGSQFSVSIIVKDATAVAGYQLTIDWNPTALEYVAITYGNYLPEPVFEVPPNIRRNGGSNSVTIGAGSLSGPTQYSDGILAKITFTSLRRTTSTISVRDLMLSDSDAMPLQVITKDGVVLLLNE